MIYRKICPICSKLFVTRKSFKIYCCDACAKKGKQLVKKLCNPPKRRGCEPSADLPPKRVCHDCGKPTHNYRCQECWDRVRAKPSW